MNARIVGWRSCAPMVRRARVVRLPDWHKGGTVSVLVVRVAGRRRVLTVFASCDGIGPDDTERIEIRTLLRSGAPEPTTSYRWGL